MTGLPAKQRSPLARFLALFHVELYPACPICGQVVYLKTMPLHLTGHKPADPDVVAWRARTSAE